MKKLLLLFSLFFVVLAGASIALTIDPSGTFQQTAYTFQEQKVNFTIRNNHNFDIFFINFSKLNDFAFPSINNLSAGGNLSIQASILTTAAYNSQVSSLITYYYKTNISVDPVTKNITISSGGFLPQNVDLIKNSQIKWTNDDTLPHTVTSTLFDATLQPGESFSFTFTNTGNVSYFDRNTNLQGKISVIEPFDLQYVHVPANDVELNFSINSILVETNYTASLLSGNLYSVEYNKKRDGVLKITNTGLTKLKNVQLSANQWISFSQNNFDLNASQDLFAVFTITPLVTNETETGRNYSLTITLNPVNALQTTLNLTVEIPLVSNVSFNQTTACDFFKEKKDFCNSFPSSPFCATEPIIKEVPIVKYESPPLPYNFTQDDIFQLTRKYLTIDDEMKKLNNFIKQEIDKIDNSTAVTKINTEQSKNTIEELRIENEERKSLNKTLIVLMVVVIVLLIAGGVIAYVILKVYKFQRGKGAMTT